MYIPILILFINIAYSKMIYLIDIGNPGARYPINDLYDGNTTSSQWGQLNSIGIRQQYLLGTYLRQDYIIKQEVISPKFNPKNIQIFVSSSIDRSIDSATSRMYGLFPVNTGWNIPQEVSPDKTLPPYRTNYSIQQNDQFALDLGFQPVPLSTVQDVINDACPNSGLLKSKRLQQILKDLSQFQKQQSVFMTKLKLIFNLSSVQLTIPTMADLYDTLQSDITIAHSLPKDFTDDDMKILKYISDYYNALLYGGDYADVFSTLILNQVQAKLRNIIYFNSQKKWSSFFIKQQNMVALVTKLNLTSPNCLTQKYKNQTITDDNCEDPPSFSANLLMEVHEDDSFSNFIKIKYNGNYVKLCGKKSTICEFQQFWKLYSTNNINYQNACYGK